MLNLVQERTLNARVPENRRHEQVDMLERTNRLFEDHMILRY
jgi:hypothetical protein